MTEYTKAERMERLRLFAGEYLASSPHVKSMTICEQLSADESCFAGVASRDTDDGHIEAGAVYAPMREGLFVPDAACTLEFSPLAN